MRSERSVVPPSRGPKLIASAAIAVYLAAVVVPPLAGPPPASALAGAVMRWMRPLVGLLHLGHGYRFFAPNPGPGHSIRWSLVRSDGSTVSGTIPDAAGDRPRLLYHRRFMVSEKLAALVPPADVPVEIREQAKRDWGPLVAGIAANLLRAERGTQVTLDLVEHFLPGPEEVLGGIVEPDLVVPLGTYRSVDPGQTVDPGLGGPGQRRPTDVDRGSPTGRPSATPSMAAVADGHRLRGTP
jgi:hypothetical protein